MLFVLETQSLVYAWLTWENSSPSQAYSHPCLIDCHPSVAAIIITVHSKQERKLYRQSPHLLNLWMETWSTKTMYLHFRWLSSFWIILSCLFCSVCHCRNVKWQEWFFPPLKSVFYLLLLHLDVQTSKWCAELNGRGFFHIHLLQGVKSEAKTCNMSSIL